MSSLPVIDPEAIASLRALAPGDNDQFLREITGIFLEDTPQRIAELDLYLASGDMAKFGRAAHSIKGSSANLGAMALREAAQQLEQRVRQEGLGGVTALLASLKLEFGRVQAELGRLFPA